MTIWLNGHYGLFDFGAGSNAHIFGVGLWSGDEWWRKHLLVPIWQAGHAIHEAKWELLYRLDPRHKYQLINTRLKPGYYDYDTRMLHGCMALLEEFVEENGGEAKLREWTDELAQGPKPGDYSPPELLEGQAGRQNEALAIYRWWKIERPADQKREAELIDLLYGKNGLRQMVTTPTETGKFMGVHFTTTPEMVETAKSFQAEHEALEAKIAKDETDYLIRLMKIRPSLWT